MFILILTILIFGVCTGLLFILTHFDKNLRRKKIYVSIYAMIPSIILLTLSIILSLKYK